MKAGDIYKTNGGCDIKIIENNGWDKVIVEFQDEHKYRVTTSRSHAENGGVKNPFRKNVYGVGYIGVGKHKSSRNSDGWKVYGVWRSIIQRCYDHKLHVKKPTYADCTVHPDWHDFQNFADWYTNHEFYGMGYHIDKDLLVKGNKIYSPDTCCLVPLQINQLVVYRGKATGCGKTGVYKRKDTGRFIAKITMRGESFRVGEFDTEHEAYKAFAVKKSEYIIEVCEEFKGLVSPDVIRSLMHTVEEIKSGEYYV